MVYHKQTTVISIRSGHLFPADSESNVMSIKGISTKPCAKHLTYLDISAGKTAEIVEIILKFIILTTNSLEKKIEIQVISIFLNKSNKL